MKKLLLILSLAPLTGLAQPFTGISDALSPWSPLSIEKTSSQLLIVASERSVTDAIFKAIIKNGICMPIWLGDEDFIQGINEVTIVNEFRKQGYVFEGGREVCEEMRNLDEEEVDMYLLGHSKLF